MSDCPAACFNKKYSEHKLTERKRNGDFWFIYMKNLSIWVKLWKKMGPNCRNTNDMKKNVHNKRKEKKTATTTLLKFSRLPRFHLNKVL